MSSATSGSGRRSHPPSSSVPPTTMSRLRGITYVGPSSASHHSSRPICSTRTTWPRTGVTDGSSARTREPRPAQFTTSGPSGSRAIASRVTVPPASSTRARSQVRYTRHVHDRGPERPAVAVRRPGRHPVERRDGSDPPRVGSPLPEELGPAAQHDAGGLVAREARQLGVRRPTPGGDLVPRERQVGVPESGRDARRRLQREVARQDVDPVAGLEQPEGTAEPHDACADHDHPVRHAAESAAPGRFPARENRGRALPGRLRRPAHGPPADGDPRADDQGRRLGARPLRRRLLQAAELDVTALHPARGHDRRRASRSGRSPARPTTPSRS